MIKKTGTKEWSTVSKNIFFGCKHNCRYCVSEDTPILMSDLTTKKIMNVQKGDKIIGVKRERKKQERWDFVETEVVDVWKTGRKTAYTIKTENGIVVKCSADHRWLTTQRWKYTVGMVSGVNRRPFLTSNSFIHTIGQTLLPKAEYTEEYMKGYLSGIIRGDGLLGEYKYTKRNRKDEQYQFRLALSSTDKIALVRTKHFLADFGIDTFEFEFQEGITGIRTSKKEHYIKIKKIIEFSDETEFMRGFLAGIIDAECAGYSSFLRIFNTNDEIISFVEKCLNTFNFRYTFDKELCGKNKNCKSIRLLGGHNECFRLFQFVTPALFRKFKLKKAFRTKVISITSTLEDCEMYDITTKTGNFIANGLVAHNCYARANAIRFKQIAKPEEWTEMHLNARSFNEHPRFYKGVENRIMMPTAHDILPEHLDVTVEYLKKWLGAGNSILIVSKPHLECITRLCNDLEQYKDQIVFRFTIGSMDDVVLKFWEPDAPSYTERMQSLKHAYKKGYKTSVSCEPYLDGGVDMVVDAVSPYVNDTIWVGLMNAIDRRVDTTGWTKEDFAFLESTKNCQTKDCVEFLYQELYENPKVRWKDSCKKILGLPEEEIG